jgi:hypothetical protein
MNLISVQSSLDVVNRQWLMVLLLSAPLLMTGIRENISAQDRKSEQVQGQGRPQAAEKGGQKIGRELLKIPTVVEIDGRYWESGRRQSFKVYLDDREVQLRSFNGPESSTVFLVVFDTVVDLARVDQARTVLAERLRELPSTYWVGILRSQDGLRVIQEPTGDREKLVAEIGSIQVNGKAGLLDTLQPLSELATGIINKTGVRVAVLYITDSGIANYRADYLNPVINASDAGDLSRRFSDRAVQEQVSRIVQSLARYTIPISILHLDYRPDTLNLAYQSGLERVAASSGGQALLCRTVDEIVPGVQTLLSRMKATYFLGVDLPVKEKSSLKVRIEAVGEDGDLMERVFHPVQIARQKGK